MTLERSFAVIAALPVSLDDHDPWPAIRAMRRTICVHFTGLLNKQCAAGIPYARVRGRAGGQPVVACLGNTACRPACAIYQAKSEADLEREDQEARRISNLIERGLSPCCEAAIDETEVIRGGEYDGHGPRYCTRCREVAFLV